MAANLSRGEALGNPQQHQQHRQQELQFFHVDFKNKIPKQNPLFLKTSSPNSQAIFLIAFYCVHLSFLPHFLQFAYNSHGVQLPSHHHSCSCFTSFKFSSTVSGFTAVEFCSSDTFDGFCFMSSLLLFTTSCRLYFLNRT